MSVQRTLQFTAMQRKTVAHTQSQAKQYLVFGFKLLLLLF